MSIEIPNSLNAAGVFANPNSFSTYPSPILSSQGVEPYDPDTSSGHILGGVTRMSTGLYIVRQVEAIDLLEGVAIAQSASGGGVYANAGLIPGAPTTTTFGLADKKAVSVQLFDGSNAAATDDGFTLSVVRFTTGPKFSDL